MMRRATEGGSLNTMLVECESEFQREFTIWWVTDFDSTVSYNLNSYFHTFSIIFVKDKRAWVAYRYDNELFIISTSKML